MMVPPPPDPLKVPPRGYPPGYPGVPPPRGAPWGACLFVADSFTPNGSVLNNALVSTQEGTNCLWDNKQSTPAAH